MSGVLAKMIFTAALGALCAVAAYIVTRPVHAQHTHGGCGGAGQRRRRSPSPPPRNSWHDYENGSSDSENETFHTPPEARRVQHRKNKAEKKDSICAICLDTFEEAMASGRDIYTTPCGHLFCKPCIVESLKRNTEKNCPSCRKRVPQGTIHPVFF